MLRLDLSDLPVASSETARRLNRLVVLNLIRDKQPISRADLARVSGLQRSTVSLIAEELIKDRWIVEGTASRLPRGRRPTMLLLNGQRRILCVDIRPVQTRIGVSDVNGNFIFEESLPTDRNPDRALQQLLSCLRRLLKDEPRSSFEGIGISLPGRVDLLSHQLVFAPNLKWPSFDLKTPIERETGIEVVLENAANACALAELWFGTLSGIRNLVAITVSEGIGTGIVLDGRLVRGSSGMAGEFGHFPMDPNGPTCSCGNRGCWEVMASDRAALRYYTQASSQTAATSERSLDFKTLLTLAERGDKFAAKALDKMALQLARGVRMIVSGLAPEALFFVGEFTAAWPRFEPVIREHVRQQSISGEMIKLIPGRDGETARLRGTVALVLQKHFGVSLRA